MPEHFLGSRHARQWCRGEAGAISEIADDLVHGDHGRGAHRGDEVGELPYRGPGHGALGAPQLPKPRAGGGLPRGAQVRLLRPVAKGQGLVRHGGRQAELHEHPPRARHGSQLRFPRQLGRFRHLGCAAILAALLAARRPEPPGPSRTKLRPLHRRGHDVHRRREPFDEPGDGRGRVAAQVSGGAERAVVAPRGPGGLQHRRLLPQRVRLRRLGRAEHAPLRHRQGLALLRGAEGPGPLERLLPRLLQLAGTPPE
mmetsp:Transcript_18475/g.42145  ORF Transcript_18475/g.42145 Transcript_18475/m.42145 type:complete len:255 (+) Transcript_18475:389-1153(+)